MTDRHAVRAALVGLTLVAGGGCRPAGGGLDVPAALRVGTSQELTPVSPFESGGLGATIAELVFRPLFREGPGGALEPDLAARYDWSDGGTVLRITLLPGQPFSDGTTVLARDVVSSWQRSKETEAWGFDEVVSVAAEDDLTVRVQPTRPFLLPGALLVGIARTGGPPLVGGGPYVAAPPEAGRLLLSANPRYPGPPPGLPAIAFHHFPNASDEWSELLARHVDVVTFLPWNKYELLAKIPTIRPVVSLSKVLVTLVLRDLPPPFDQAAGRRALSFAIDRAELVETALRGQGLAAAGPLWPGGRGADPSVRPMTHDPDEARRLLAQLGCSVREEDGRMHHGGEPLRLDVWYQGGAPGAETVALLLERQLGEAGIEAHFHDVTATELRRRVLGGEAGAFINLRHAASDLLSDREYRALPPPPTPPELDTPEAVEQALRDAQRRLADEVPAIPLVWLNRLDVIDRHLCGLPALADGPETRLDRVHRCADGEDR